MNRSRNSMTRITDTGHDRVDVIMFPGTFPTTDPRSRAALRCRIRWLVDLGLMATVIVLVVAVTQPASGPDAAAPIPAASISGGSHTASSAGGARASHPRLIAPDTASAGEQITVLAYA